MVRRFKIIRPVRPSTRKNKKKMVTVQVGRTVKTIHFGQKGFPNNQTKQARENFLRRSAGIRDSQGRLTKDNPLSANFWARRVLWKAPRRKT